MVGLMGVTSALVLKEKIKMTKLGDYIRKQKRKATFDEIKVGEVFATLGCTNYFVKTGKEEAVLVDADVYDSYIGEGFIFEEGNCFIELSDTLAISISLFDGECPGYVFRVPEDVQARYVA